MKKWYEWGPLNLATTSSDTVGVDVSPMGLTSPTIVSETSYDVTDPANISTVDITTGSGSLSTTIYTPPLMTPAETDKTYHLVTVLSDSGATRTIIGTINAVHPAYV